jgi:hypothetical protein
MTYPPRTYPAAVLVQIKNKAMVAALTLLAFCISAGTVAASEHDASIEAKSRSLAQALGSQLTAELSEALSAGGPAQAIAVCKDRAPQIAAELSRQSGARVGRVSRRFRNPANAPEPWQIAALQRFEAEIAEGSTPADYLHISSEAARYMKPIRIQPLCLVCHGDTLSAEVRTLLDAHYPHDQARGYQAGELRGAFTVSWPVSL